jgi:hypothetical protein
MNAISFIQSRGTREDSPKDKSGCRTHPCAILSYPSWKVFKWIIRCWGATDTVVVYMKHEIVFCCVIFHWTFVLFCSLMLKGAQSTNPVPLTVFRKLLLLRLWDYWSFPFSSPVFSAFNFPISHDCIFVLFHSHDCVSSLVLFSRLYFSSCRPCGSCYIESPTLSHCFLSLRHDCIVDSESSFQVPRCQARLLTPARCFLLNLPPFTHVFRCMCVVSLPCVVIDLLCVVIDL